MSIKNKLEQLPSYSKGLAALRTNLKEMIPEETLIVFDTDAQQLENTHRTILKVKVGDTAPNFALKNAVGATVKLYDLLRNGKVVLTFYRGTWCPYCNLQLAQYQQVLEEITALGAQLVAISPQNPDNSLDIVEKNNLKFQVLSDTGNEVAKAYTTVFTNGVAPVDTMQQLGIDFDSFYDDNSRELPVPAVFIISETGKIEFAAATGGDYRNRVEASTILDALSVG